MKIHSSLAGQDVRRCAGYLWHPFADRARPHQGIKQQIPEQYGEPVQPDHDGGMILSFPVVGGLHHDYCRSA